MLRDKYSTWRISRGMVAALASGLVVSVGASAALAVNLASGRGSSNGQRASSYARPLQGRHATPKAGRAFAAFSHKVAAHLADTGSSSMLPPQAVLLSTVGNHSVYMWELQKGESTGQRGPLAKEQMLCIGEVIQGVGASAGCGSATVVAERGSVTFGQHLIPGTETQSPVEVTAVVPNGVQSVKVIAVNGASREVTVTNNVAVVEDAAQGNSPATSVSYQLANGKDRSVPMPPGMTTP
jgi:hypothetical protein